MDVKSLIQDWQIIRSTAPAQEVSEEMSLGHREVSEIAYMSRRKERWEVFISLMGFQEVAKLEPNAVLSEVEDYVLKHQKSELASSFLQYSSEFVTITREQFLREAVRLRRDFGNNRIMTLSSSFEVLRECRARHEPDWDKVWKCVLEAGGGASASATASAAAG